MSYENYNSFIQTLISETMSKSRKWNYLQQPTEEQNKDLFYALFECEWHHVDLSKSYSLSFSDGYIYLINEWSESGRDGTIFDGYKLYVQPTINEPLTLVASDTNDLYRLKNAIEENLEINDSALDFMKRFTEA